MRGITDLSHDAPRGWNKLIQETHMKLLAVDPLYEVLQIKEKFGALRYYISAKIKDTTELTKIIIEAEYKSRKICQNCGKEGASRQVNGWHATLCTKCWDKQERGYE